MERSPYNTDGSFHSVSLQHTPSGGWQQMTSDVGGAATPAGARYSSPTRSRDALFSKARARARLCGCGPAGRAR